MLLPTTCPKCAGWMDPPKFCRGCREGGPQEHLHRKCACGYRSTEETRDAHLRRTG